MTITEFLSDYYLLGEKMQNAVKEVLDEFVNEALAKNIKEGKIDKLYTIDQDASSNFVLISSHIEPYDLRAPSMRGKYEFLKSHGILDFQYNDIGSQYAMRVTVLDVAFLIEINKALKAKKQIVLENDPTTLELSNFSDLEEHEYHITYNPFDPHIKINGVKYHKLSISAGNDSIFGYIYKNPNREILYSELQEKVDMHKTISNFLKDIGINAVIKDLFFPRTNDKQVYFRNPVKIHIIYA